MRCNDVGGGHFYYDRAINGSEGIREQRSAEGNNTKLDLVEEKEEEEKKLSIVVDVIVEAIFIVGESV